MSQSAQFFKPIARYLIALAMTYGAYTLYTKFVVPIVQPVPPKVTRLPVDDLEDRKIPIDDKTTYEHLFAEADWELQTCKTLEISQGKILFQDYKRHGDGSWDVFPFTMILQNDPAQESSPKPADKNQQPFVLRSRKGAKLIFDRPIQFGARKEQAKLERAQLKGNVELYRGATAPGKNDAVRIDTRNVQLTNSRIFTLDDVWFQFGNNRGSGRNMTIDLSHKTPPGSITTDFSKINGITRVQLAFLKSMRIETSAIKQQNAGASVPLASDGAPLEITADGAFVFDMQRSRAEFHESVVVKKLDEFGDTLQCEDLLLQFKNTGPIKTPSFTNTSNTEYRLQAIDARGKAGTSDVSDCILTANSQQAQVIGQQLFYDIERGLIDVRGSRQVEIKQDNKTFRAGQLIYNVAQNGRMGDLDAVGPGTIIQQATATEKPFRAAWKNRLTIRSDGPASKLITLAGGAMIELDATTSITSESLEMWMHERQVEIKPGESKFEYQPQKLVAKTNVEIKSPDISGTANELNAVWQDANGANGGKGPDDRTSRRIGALTPARLSDQANVVRRVSYLQNAPVQNAPVQNASAPKKGLQFNGNRVDVVLGGTREKTKIIDLTITDDVRVWQKRQPDSPATDIKGDFLRAVPQDAENYRIQVQGRGKDAIVVSDQMKLVGPNLQLDQQANRMWVEGKGTMQLKGKVAAGGLVPEGQFVGGRIVNVNWNGGMIFDGQKIYFEEQVGCKVTERKPGGATTNTNTFSQALNISLSKRFDFSNTDAQSSSDIEIHEMIFVNQLPASKAVFRQASARPQTSQPVALEHVVRNSIGQVQEVIKVVAPQATVRTSTNQIVAHGPGSLILYRRGAPSSNGLGFARVKKSGSNPNALTMVHSKFDQTLVANTQTQQVDITGNTRTVYMPVTKVGQQFDPDSTVELPEGAVKLTCGRIKMTRWSPSSSSKPTSELIATVNAQIAAPTFKATAERISYHEQSDLLTIVGNSRTDAKLWFRKTPRDSWNHGAATKILYNVGNQWTDVQGVKNAEFNGRR